MNRCRVHLSNGNYVESLLTTNEILTTLGPTGNGWLVLPTTRADGDVLVRKNQIVALENEGS